MRVAAEAMKIDASAFNKPTSPSGELDILLDGLLRLGVAAASPVEAALSRLRKNPK